jgi:hypothetical protein
MQRRVCSDMELSVDWMFELKSFDCYPMNVDGKQCYSPPAQRLINLLVTDWIRREENALRFRMMLYGEGDSVDKSEIIFSDYQESARTHS